MLAKLMRAAFGLCLITLSVAHAETAIEITDAWVRSAPPSSKVMAGYMKLINHSEKTITLSGISSPQFDKIEVHRSVMHDGMMHMKKIEPLSLAGHQQLLLEPGGYHLMLIRPVGAIARGERVHLNFDFDNGDKLSLMAEIMDNKEVIDPTSEHQQH